MSTPDDADATRTGWSAESTTDVGVIPAGEQLVGPYRLVRKLGEGGMASVFLAKRADREYKKLVAIKLIRAGFDSPEAVGRFQQERQILAAFDHPNIARLLDGGTTPEGTPYIVMEYIEGESIDVYCKQRRLSIKERVRLFVQVCDAVQAAHAHLVIHRDIKPSNIIVTPEGVLKLLDFGTAKLLSPGDRVDGLTVTVQHAMTPLYASPEQIRGDPISTASDVYSLGVLLHELLTGRVPYRLTGTDLGQVARAVSEQEPSRPSTAVPGLKGDVDSIVLKALSKRPEHRYRSAEALASDVRNYLEGFPVKARSATWPYRAARFVSRHRWGVAAATALLAVIIGASVTLAVQSVRIERERDKTQRLADFLTGLFQLSGPEKSRGRTITAREILDRGTDKIARDRATAPDVRAAFMLTMADVYQQLGLYDQAFPLARESVALRELHLGPDDTDSLRARVSLGTILWRKGDLPGAESSFRDALDRYRKRPRTDRQIEIRLLAGLSHLLYTKGDYKASEAAAQEALDLQRRYPNPDPQVLPSAIFSLATAVHVSGDLVRAESLYREAIELFRVAGANPIDLSRTRFNFAILLKDRGEYKESAALIREGLVDYRRILGAEHPEVGRNLNNLAVTLIELGDYSAAEAAARETLAIYRKTLPADHIELEAVQETIAHALNAQGRFAEAEPLIRDALAILAKSGGADHPYTPIDMATLGTSLEGQGRMDEAERAFRKAFALYKVLPSPGNSDKTIVLVGLGSLLTERGHVTEAEPLLREALAGREKRYPAGNWRLAEAKSALGANLVAQRRFDEAAQLLIDASTVLTDRGKTTPEAQLALRRTVHLFEAWGKPDQQEQYRRMLVDSQAAPDPAQDARSR